MTQTRLHSALESVANVAVGYSVAVLTQIAVYPAYGIHVAVTDQLSIGGWFTLVSLVRSYALRRWFNTKQHRPS